MIAIGPYEVALIIVLSAVATGMIFARRGRGGLAGFVVGLILGPIGVAIALILSPRPASPPLEPPTG